MSAHHHHKVTYFPWSPRVGDRVVVRNGGMHVGEAGVVTGQRGRYDHRYIVKLDAHEVERLFPPRDLQPEETQS